MRSGCCCFFGKKLSTVCRFCPLLSLSYSLLVLLLNFCIFLFTSFARMFERFECLNADGVREEIETMFKVSSCTSRNRKLKLSLPAVAIFVAVAVAACLAEIKTSSSELQAASCAWTVAAKFELLSELCFCCFCCVAVARFYISSTIGTGHACLFLSVPCRQVSSLFLVSQCSS